MTRDLIMNENMRMVRAGNGKKESYCSGLNELSHTCITATHANINLSSFISRVQRIIKIDARKRTTASR